MGIASGEVNFYDPDVLGAAVFLLELLVEKNPQAAISALAEVAKKDEELAIFIFRAAIGDVAPLYKKPK